MTKLIANRVFETLPPEKKREYFENLKNECLKFKANNDPNIFQTGILKICPIIRHFPYKIEGAENIPTDTSALFLCNHSNSHDFFTIQEVFKQLDIPTTVFGASDDINFATQFVFNSCHAELFDRKDKESVEKGLLRFCCNLLAGMYGVIFGEATWNLHPIKLMQDIKIGGANIAAIADIPIIPTEFEYIESPYFETKEKNLYTKCIVRFGKPIYINRERSLIPQTHEVQNALEELRLSTLTKEHALKSIDSEYKKQLYLNHTWLKKFGAFGFTYDSESESKFLFSHDGTPIQNEFTEDEQGNFVPGITSKKEGKKYIKRMH